VTVTVIGTELSSRLFGLDRGGTKIVTVDATSAGERAIESDAPRGEGLQPYSLPSLKRCVSRRET
jgi:hypothetical protein